MKQTTADNRQLVFFPTFAMFICHIEMYLSRMALNGWELIEYSKWQYTFQKQQPAHRQYFLYFNMDAGRGFHYDYQRAQTIYKKRKSSLQKCFSFFEVDLTKKDATFDTYLETRNRYYLRYFGFLFLAVLPISVLTVLLTLNTPPLWPICVLFVFLSAYYGISYFVFRQSVVKHQHFFSSYFDKTVDDSYSTSIL